MDGLLHITDMSWGRISHPSELLKQGEEIEVMITKSIATRRGFSSLEANEVQSLGKYRDKYPIGTHVKGKVVNLVPYGAFIEIEEGVEGLVHVTEMS